VARIRFVWLAGILLALLAPDPAVAATCSGPTCAPVVVGDPSDAAYVGSGGLIVDSTFSGNPTDRQRIAECVECRWWLTPVCWRDPANVDAGCRVVATCLPGWVRMAIWYSNASEPAHVVGLYCLGPTGPVTTVKVAKALTGGFVRRLPALHAAQQPSITLTGLPTVFRAGQVRQAGPWNYRIVGFAVTVRAVTSWTWTFGDGTSLTTTNPGGVYPNLGVTHIYRRPGTFLVSLRSNWVGSYTVSGLGPFPISPAVSQIGSFSAVVRQARAVLIDPA